MKLQITSGERFGKLSVLSEGVKLVLPSGQTNRTVNCLCDCGNIKLVRLLHIVRGRVTSCGCIRPHHGMTPKGLHTSWRAMNNRCHQKGHINHNRYIDRGITMCDEWRSFPKFRDWALENGWKDGLTLDRKDNNKGYYPDNCRFVTQLVNCNNREVTLRVLYNGEIQPLGLILHDQKKTQYYHTIHARIERGWSPDEAINSPIRKGNYRRKNP